MTVVHTHRPHESVLRTHTRGGRRRIQPATNSTKSMPRRVVVRVVIGRKNASNLDACGPSDRNFESKNA